MRRITHHLALAGINGAALAAAMVSGPAEQWPDQVSIVTAYLCLGLLCAGLAIGPARAFRTGRPSVNLYLRRDIGIWAALTGLAHLVIATALSMTPGYMETFVDNAGVPPSQVIRMELFTWSTIAGLVVGVLLLVLLGLSNDKSLRWVGPRWWKRLHRLSYLAFALTAAHGIAFQALESRTGALIAVVILASLVVLVLQITGSFSVRQSAQLKAGNTR